MPLASADNFIPGMCVLTPASSAVLVISVVAVLQLYQDWVQAKVITRTHWQSISIGLR